ncbi:MAG: DNA alkylation repair enzyme [Erysipelotrichaceae bacterium]|nr:MAG: DNA alkylation repair [Erysipelotrichaceae bacterium]TXT19661.1 MAG: DNA alkylation repair enzyme [Erysipelotrichaceae bacterium]
MTTQDIINEISTLSNEKVIRIYQKQGITEKILGIYKGPLRKIAETLKINHPLALELWDTNIYEARIIATMVFDPSQLNITSLEKLINETDSTSVIDELTFEIFEEIKDQKTYIDEWLHHPNLKLQRAAWNMAIILAHKKKLTETEMDDLIKIIEANLVTIDPMVQYAMNRCLCEIGITHDAYTEQCLEIGERLGVYKEMKVSKGCTSPYAPDWIHAVRRKKV